MRVSRVVILINVCVIDLVSDLCFFCEGVKLEELLFFVELYVSIVIIIDE